jgi:hypothetical protein
MAWSESKVFRPFLGDVMTNAQAFDLSNGGDTIRAALYNNDITPDVNVSSANSAYDAGQWASANEVSDAGEWDAGGVALTSQQINEATNNVVFFDAADTASGSDATLADVFGALIYDDTVSDLGVCFNYFGGSNSVTAGTFTVVWDSDGVWRATI